MIIHARHDALVGGQRLPISYPPFHKPLIQGVADKGFGRQSNFQCVTGVVRTITSSLSARPHRPDIPAGDARST